MAGGAPWRRFPVWASSTRGSSLTPPPFSCLSALNCSAGGFYFDASIHQHAFVVTKLNGRWGTAIPIPGLAALDKGFDGYVYSVSCASARNCGAGGIYKDGGGHIQAFIRNATSRRKP